MKLRGWTRESRESRSSAAGTAAETERLRVGTREMEKIRQPRAENWLPPNAPRNRVASDRGIYGCRARGALVNSRMNGEIFAPEISHAFLGELGRSAKLKALAERYAGPRWSTWRSRKNQADR